RRYIRMYKPTPAPNAPSLARIALLALLTHLSSACVRADGPPPMPTPTPIPDSETKVEPTFSWSKVKVKLHEKKLLETYEKDGRCYTRSKTYIWAEIDGSVSATGVCENGTQGSVPVSVGFAGSFL